MTSRVASIFRLSVVLACWVTASYLFSTEPSAKVTGLIRQLGSQNFAEREQAAKDLISIGPPALDFLRKALKDPDLEIALRAMKVIPEIELNDKIQHLIADLNNPDAKVRAKSANSLMLVGKRAQSAVPALTAALNDKDYDAWQGAAYALSCMAEHAEPAVPRLIEILRDKESSKDAKRVTAFVLGEIGGSAEKAVPLLLVIVAEEKETSLRNTAVGALGNLGQNQDRVVPALMNALTDPDLLMQANAALALGKIRKEPASCVPAILDVLKKHKGAEKKIDHRDRILLALSHYGKEAKLAVPSLLDIVKDQKEDVFLRRQAVSVLGKIGPAAKDAIPVLIQIMKDRGFDGAFITPPAAEALKTIQGK